jgi:hypothetical protein
METRVDEIAERIYRLSTFLPRVGPSGLARTVPEQSEEIGHGLSPCRPPKTDALWFARMRDAWLARVAARGV